MSLIGRTKAVIAGSLISAALYMSGLLVILTPLPMIYVSLTRGRARGFLVGVVGAVCVAAIYAFVLPASAARGASAYVPLPGSGISGFLPAGFELYAGLGYFVFFISIAMALAEGAHRRWGLTRMGVVALGVGLAVAVIFAAGSVMFGIGSVIAGLKSYARQVLDQVIQMNQAGGQEAAFSSIAERKDEVIAFMGGISPALVFSFALLTVVLNLVVGRRLIRGCGHPFAHLHNVARFRLPDGIVWAVIAGGTVFFFDGYLLHSGWLKLAAVNALIGLLSLYFFQGIAVVAYFIQNIRLPLVKTMAYVALILFFQTVSLMVVVVGLADVWVDFRLRSWRARHTHET